MEHASARREMTAGEEQQIRERAYSIWEQEGRPHGRDVDHRLRAEAEIAAERSRGGATAQQRQDDRERLAKAAEALFKPSGQQVIEPSRREDAAPKAGPARKPRVLPSLPKACAPREELEGARSSKPQMMPKIARSQFARIRTLVRYGMTARQVAEVYGVAVGDIERILQTA
jgi:DUF2934 family protein